MKTTEELLNEIARERAQGAASLSDEIVVRQLMELSRIADTLEELLKMARESK